MWILVASAFRPSSKPGEEDLARQLETALRARGHEVDSVQIPFDCDSDELWAQLFAFRMTNVSDVGELLVATGTPSHLLRHRRKVLWLTEHYPWLDDESPELRSLMDADRQAYAEASATFAVSEALCDRISRSSGGTAQLLAPPPAGSWDRVIATLTCIDAGREGA
jgi:hypothetical protein